MSRTIADGVKTSPKSRTRSLDLTSLSVAVSLTGIEACFDVSFSILGNAPSIWSVNFFSAQI